MLVDTRIELAQKQADYEELSLKYIQLEKMLCDVKLQLAKYKASVPYDAAGV